MGLYLPNSSVDIDMNFGFRMNRVSIDRLTATNPNSISAHAGRNSQHRASCPLRPRGVLRFNDPKKSQLFAHERPDGNQAPDQFGVSG